MGGRENQGGGMRWGEGKLRGGEHPGQPHTEQHSEVLGVGGIE